jgi:hypothetical protein
MAKDFRSEAIKNELKAQMKEMSTGELALTVAENALPGSKKEWAGFGALVIGGAVASDLLLGPVSTMGHVVVSVVGANVVATGYAGTRTGIKSHYEITELVLRAARRMYSIVKSEYTEAEKMTEKAMKAIRANPTKEQATKEYMKLAAWAVNNEKMTPKESDEWAKQTVQVICSLLKMAE